MLDAILKNIVSKTINKCIGLNVIVEGEETSYQVVLLEKSKSGDLIPVKDQLFSQPDLMKQWVEENAINSPVLWGVEGRHVLTKVIESETELEEEQLIKLLLPNAKENDFVVNALFEQGHYYCSVIRRDVFETQLASLIALNLNLYQGFVGPVIGLSIREHLLDSLGADYKLGHYQIEESDGVIQSIRKNQDDLLLPINNQFNLPHRALNAFSYAATFFTGVATEIIVAETIESGKSADEYIHRRVFKPFFVTTITILLIAFMGNAYFYMDFKKENDVLKEKSSSTQLLIKTYQKQQALYQKKDKIVKSLNYNNIGVAWISDQIAQIVPSKVSLKSLIIDPVSRDKKQSSPFDQNEIHLSGYSDNNVAFGKLISKLSKLEFVDEISYQQYQYNKSKRKGEFLIKLKYKTE